MGPGSLPSSFPDLFSLEDTNLGLRKVLLELATRKKNRINGKIAKIISGALQQLLVHKCI